MKTVTGRIDRIVRLAPFAILGLAFFLRVLDLGRNSLWYDEILQLRIAGGSLPDFINELAKNAAMPLDYLIERVVLQFGSGEFMLRFPAAALSTLSVALLYRLGRSWFGRLEGGLASLFLAASSFSILYAQEARPYSLYLLLVLASFYFLYRTLQTNRLSDWLAYAVCLSGAVLAHLFALFVILAQLLFIMAGLGVRFLAPRRARLFARITWRTVVGGLVAFGLLVAALVITSYIDEVLGSAQRFLAFLLAPSVPPPQDWSGIAPGESPPFLTLDFVYSRVVENLSGGGLPATGAFLLLGISGAAAKLRAKPWETGFLVIWAFVPTSLIFLFLIHRATLFAARYLIIALPPWLLLCACGALALGAAVHALVSRLSPGMRGIRFRFAASAVILALWLFISLDRSAAAIATQKENWRAAGYFLERNLRPGDAVLAPGGSFVIYHYARIAEKQNVPADLAAQVADVENHFPRVWLVMDRYVFDPGGEIKAWLQGRGAVDFRVDGSIELYYWRSHADNAALLADVKNMTLPSTSMALAGVGDQFAAAGDLEQAERYYGQALERAASGAERARLEQGLGDNYRRANGPEDAARHYRAALALDPNLVEAWVGLARTYLEQDQLTAAHDALTRALALDPNSYPALLFLADFYQRSGDPAAAQQAYVRAAAIVPELTIPP